MSEFSLDTSGSIQFRDSHGELMTYRWSDLTPFEQGYVEAMFASLYDPVFKKPVLRSGPIDFRGVAFRHLAPETLARILKDCEAYRGERDKRGPYPASYWTAETGADFWGSRQAGTWISFPLLDVTLADDGLIYLRESDPVSSLRMVKEGEK